MEAAVREALTFRSGPDGRNKHLWSGSGGGLQGRGPLSAAGKARPEGVRHVAAVLQHRRIIRATVMPKLISKRNQSLRGRA
jgi:hypothetical protein